MGRSPGVGIGSKNSGYLGCVRAFQLVSSTPMNGLSELTLAPFKIWLCATEGWHAWREAYPASRAHVG